MKHFSILPAAALALLWIPSCDIQIDKDSFQVVSTVDEETTRIADGAWSIYSDLAGITVDEPNTHYYTVSELFTLYSSVYFKDGSGVSDSEKDIFQNGFKAFCNGSLGGYDIPASDEKYWEVARITYNYGGKDLPGKLIWCTHGEAHTPINPRYVIIDSHWTMTGAEEFPSVGTPPVIALARMDAVYICPDQMADGEPQPYLCEEVTANRTIAMVKASLGYLDSIGMDPLQSCEGYSIGYSQGGASALAVHRAIEKDSPLSQAIGFSGTYSGAGPYNMNLTLEKWIENGTLTFPAAIGLIALAWDCYYPEEVGANSAVNCFLSQKFRDSGALADIAARSSNIGAINAKIAASVGSVNVNQLLAADWDSDSYAFKGIATSNNLLDGSWYPEHPVVFFHSKDDEVVPFANSTSARDLFKDHCPVTLIEKEGYHSQVGADFYTWMGMQQGFPNAIHELIMTANSD